MEILSYGEITEHIKFFRVKKFYLLEKFVETKNERPSFLITKKIINRLMFRAAMGQAGNPFSIFLLEDQKLHDG
jgi:hypothetical protein